MSANPIIIPGTGIAMDWYARLALALPLDWHWHSHSQWLCRGDGSIDGSGGFKESPVVWLLENGKVGLVVRDRPWDGTGN